MSLAVKSYSVLPSVDAHGAVLENLDAIELEVEKRCREIMTHTDVFISRLHGELAKHMVLFPKHVRAMKAEELFGIRSEDVENVRSTADTILQSCKRPSRPPLTSHQGLSTPAAPRIAPSASAVCPGSAVPDLAAFNIEDPTSKLIMTAFVSKIRSLEDELAALRNKHVQGGEAGGRR